MNSLGSRAGLVALVLTFVVGSAFGIEWLLGLGEGVEFGHSRRGHLLGWVGLLVLLPVFIYSLKKRYAPEAPRRGWLQPLTEPSVTLVTADERYYRRAHKLGRIVRLRENGFTGEG